MLALSPGHDDSAYGDDSITFGESADAEEVSEFSYIFSPLFVSVFRFPRVISPSSSQSISMLLFSLFLPVDFYAFGPLSGCVDGMNEPLHTI